MNWWELLITCPSCHKLLSPRNVFYNAKGEMKFTARCPNHDKPYAVFYICPLGEFQKSANGYDEEVMRKRMGELFTETDIKLLHEMGIGGKGEKTLHLASPQTPQLGGTKLDKESH